MKIESYNEQQRDLKLLPPYGCSGLPMGKQYIKPLCKITATRTVISSRPSLESAGHPKRHNVDLHDGMKSVMNS